MAKTPTPKGVKGMAKEAAIEVERIRESDQVRLTFKMGGSDQTILIDVGLARNLNTALNAVLSGRRVSTIALPLRHHYTKPEELAPHFPRGSYAHPSQR